MKHRHTWILLVTLVWLLSISINCNSTTDKAVFFVDANLEQVVRETIGKPTGAIRKIDLLELTVLDANN